MIKTSLDIFRNDMILVDRNNGGMDFEKHVELKNGTLHSIVLEEVAAWEENYDKKNITLNIDRRQLLAPEPEPVIKRNGRRVIKADPNVDTCCVCNRKLPESPDE